MEKILDNDTTYYMDFSNTDELLHHLIEQVLNIENDEYESVKLYGNSELMFTILKHVLSLNRYDFIRVGCISLSANWFDENDRDEYVLEINSDYELSIQNAWNGNELFENEAKYSVCMNYCSDAVFFNVFKNNIPLIVANIR